MERIGHKINNIQDIVGTAKYDFLRTDSHIAGKLMFLAFGGSHAYGTSVGVFRYSDRL